MAEKIRVSWDDVNSPVVDDKIKQQEALSKAQQHYQHQTSTATPAPPSAGLSPSTPSTASAWYNALVYMTVFGVLGGLLAWLLGEAIWHGVTTKADEYQQLIRQAQDLVRKQQQGLISQESLKLKLDQLEADSRNRKNPYIAIELDYTLDEVARRQKLQALRDADYWAPFFKSLIFFSVCGVALALCLGIANEVVCRNWRGVVVNGSVGIMLGLIGGILVGLFIDSLFRAMMGIDTSPGFGRIMLARAIAWGILGLFLAVGPGIVMKNLKRLLIGLAGGAIGGLIGGALFDPLDYVFGSETLSRGVGLLAIGGVTGYATGLIENATKTGWLKVTAGLIVGKQFVLYRNPTYIGSSPQCEIYLFKDPNVMPRHAAIHSDGRSFEIEDLQTGVGTFVNGSAVSHVRLRSGDRIQIGSSCFAFQEKERNSEDRR